MFNDKTRLYFSFVLIFLSLGLFVYGWIERSNGNDFNQIWSLSLLMLFGAMIHLQKIGSSKKKNLRNKINYVKIDIKIEDRNEFINEIKTGPAGSGDKVYAYAAPYSTVVYLRGTYGIDWVKPISPAIPDPAFDAAYRLADTLRTAGIALSEAPTTWRRMQEFKPVLTS